MPDSYDEKRIWTTKVGRESRRIRVKYRYLEQPVIWHARLAPKWKITRLFLTQVSSNENVQKLEKRDEDEGALVPRHWDQNTQEITEPRACDVPKGIICVPTIWVVTFLNKPSR